MTLIASGIFYQHLNSKTISFKCFRRSLQRSCQIKGHEFLANIKAPNNYKRIKEALKKIGGASLEAIFPVAASIVAEEIKKSMGL